MDAQFNKTAVNRFDANDQDNRVQVSALALTSNLMPTAPEFIPSAYRQPKIEYEERSTCMTSTVNNQSDYLDSAPDAGPSRNWWKQYKSTPTYMYSRARTKWKYLESKTIGVSNSTNSSDHDCTATVIDDNNEPLFEPVVDSTNEGDWKKRNNKSSVHDRRYVNNYSNCKKYCNDYQHKNNNYYQEQFYENPSSKSTRNLNSSKIYWNEKRSQFPKSNEKSTRRSSKTFQTHYFQSASNSNFKDDESSSINISAVSQRESLKFSLDKGTLECLVCCENIKTIHPVWSCLGCHHVLHLMCINKWAITSKAGSDWRCPACQRNYNDIPNSYYCFCGKICNPRYNKYDGAHTCGQVCGRVGVYPCVHSCTLLCHPGPCPPCQAQVQRNCACGKTARIVLCKQTETLLCGKPCEKMLNCHLHTCQEMCHEGDCKKCEVINVQECYCGKENKEVSCTTETILIKNYSCGNTCGKELDCGNHTCRSVCHDGVCEPCLLKPHVVLTCPCGKKPLEFASRTSCTDPVPSCGNICGKTLNCGSIENHHKCANVCHEGPCSDCPLETSMRCLCGHMDINMKCAELALKGVARCLKRCSKKRDCGKHKCNKVCCILEEHPCTLPCRRMLSCGLHNCDRNCHKGRCEPCWRSSFNELSCECGFNIRHPPIPCGARRPTCDQPCSRQHACDHPVMHTCHSDPECPPCTVLCSKWCFGKHEMRKTIPCHQEDFSCGRPCGKPLLCGKHACLLPCHKGACTQTCTQPCEKPRTTCNHICRAPCHEGNCPDTPCKEKVLVTCQCKLRSITRTCSETSRDYQRIATGLLASKIAEMQTGATIDIQDILNKRSTANLKILECNEECRLAERNRRMMLGLQITNPNTSSKLNPRYSEFLKQWAKRDSSFVSNIHNKLTELVQLSKQSKQKFRSHSFPVMNKEKRQIVHEMCEYFGIESQAYDPEPNRNVVATADKEKCWLPSMSILEVIQRENGQRKVPVPSLSMKSSRQN